MIKGNAAMLVVGLLTNTNMWPDVTVECNGAFQGGLGLRVDLHHKCPLYIWCKSTRHGVTV